MGFSRRDFIRTMLMTSGAAAFGNVLMTDIGQALSEPLQPGGAPDFRRRFIFCYFSGGWDVLLSADPRDPSVFTDELRGETFIQPAYGRLPAAYSQAGTEGNGLFYDPVLDLALGPACGPIWRHRNEMCVVRGINMNTVTHQVGYRYLLTGRMPSGLLARGASIPAEIAAQLYGHDGAPSEMPIVPNLAYAVESYNDRLESFASGLKISSVEDLLRAISRADVGYTEAEERFIVDYLNRPTSHGLPVAAMPEALRRARDSKIQSEAVLAAQLDQSFEFPEGLNLRSGEAVGLLAVQAITKGICASVSLRIASGALDTHDEAWATAQPAGQESGFRVIDNIVQSLKDAPFPDGTGDSWLDHTTVVAFSEFSRTPLINSAGGRDHHPVGSVMMWGAGVPHGKVVGASSDEGMLKQSINLRTGQPDLFGVDIRPEDVLGTVMANAGMDGSLLGRDVRFIHALET